MSIQGDKIIPLTLTERYAASWGTWEGVRELVQNWHDGIYETMASHDLPLDFDCSAKFKKVTHGPMNEEYEAYINNKQLKEKITLGRLVFDAVTSSLTLINHLTSLQRKILLLGYSGKADKKEVIGHFGEGLKIGALALLRQGHVVTMETSEDIWRFDILHNEEFGERMLSIVVKERTSEREPVDKNTDCYYRPYPTSLSSSDTCTTVAGLDWSDWKQCVSRFLFLQPPKECVKTELGTLLLDDALTGQLYVKGLWVADMKDQDLAAGVNFTHLDLDRDRNAVPKPSEIDHLMSGVWIKAVKKKPDLLVKYFHLLQDDKYRDVKHAAQYITEDLAEKVANQFVIAYGNESFPLLNNSSIDVIQSIQDELNLKVILCSSTLLDLLHKSGKFEAVELALSKKNTTERSILSFSSLNPHQRVILQEAVELVKLADKEFSMSLIDVVKTHSLEKCRLVYSKRVEVPLWMFDIDMVHEYWGHSGCCGKDLMVKCKCRETLMCCAILDHRKQPTVGNTLLSISPYSMRLHHKVLSKLAKQACDVAEKKYCEPVHEQQLNVPEKMIQRLRMEFQEREEMLQKTITDLNTELLQNAATSSEEMANLQESLQLVNNEIMEREISFVNGEQVLKDRFEEKLRKMTTKAEETITELQMQIKAEKERNTGLHQTIIHKDNKIEESKKQMKTLSDVMDKKQSLLVEELSHYIDQHRKRTEILSKYCKEAINGNDRQTGYKWTACSNLCDIILQDVQVEKIICAVCKIRRKDTLLAPCHHYNLCEVCAGQIKASTSHCPVCKTRVITSIKVFE